jgi:Na+/proline symporter
VSGAAAGQPGPADDGVAANPARDDELTRRALLIVAMALVLVPLIAVIALGLELARGGDPLARGLVAAGLGGATGASAALVARRRDRRRTTSPGQSVGGAVIAGAAVLGTFSDLLPGPLDAFLNGAVIGFFFGLWAILTRLWRTDERFRSRIQAARRT